MDPAVLFLFSSQCSPKLDGGPAYTVTTETGLQSGGKDNNWLQNDLGGKIRSFYQVSERLQNWNPSFKDLRITPLLYKYGQRYSARRLN